MAEGALNNLTGEHCPRGILIVLLRRISDPASKQIWNHFVRDCVPSRKRATEVAQILDRAAVCLEAFAGNPFVSVALARHEASRSPQTDNEDSSEVPTIIRPCSELEGACTLADAMKRQAHRMRAFSESSAVAEASRLLNYRTVWKHLPLAVAVHVIKRQKGQIPWSDLAYALEAVAAGYGTGSSISPDALRKQYTGFIQSKLGKHFLKADGMDAVLRLLPQLAIHN